MTNNFRNYLLWAFIQHFLVLTIVHFLELSFIGSYYASVLIFSIVHIPNSYLMLITFMAGVLMYGSFFILYYNFGNYAFLVFLINLPLHAYFGRWLLSNGVNLGVWTNYKK